MTTWRERARRLRDLPSEELPELPKAPFVSFGSESVNEIPKFFDVGKPANASLADTGGTGCDTFGRPLPLVQCGNCAHFTRNRDNPEAGIGACALGEPDAGGRPYFPGARRCCDRHIVCADP